MKYLREDFDIYKANLTSEEDRETAEIAFALFNETEDIYERLIEAMVTCYENEDDTLLLACSLLSFEENVISVMPEEIRDNVLYNLETVDEGTMHRFSESKPFDQLLITTQTDTERKLDYRLKLDYAYKMMDDSPFPKQYVRYRSILNELILSIMEVSPKYSKVALLGGIRKAKDSLKDYYTNHFIDIQMMMDKFEVIDEICNSEKVKEMYEEHKKMNAS